MFSLFTGRFRRKATVMYHFLSFCLGELNFSFVHFQTSFGLRYATIKVENRLIGFYHGNMIKGSPINNQD